MNSELSNHIKAEAKSLGFYACGIAKADAVDNETATRFQDWLAQGKNADMAYLNNYTDKRLETACKLALQKDSAPSYSYLKNILAQNLDKEAEQPPKPRKAHAFLRGAAYYGGGSHEE